MQPKTMKKPLLEVKNLKTYFFTEDGVVKAVDGVDFVVYPGEVLGLVGESGCGKSVSLLSVMRLISQPGKITEGEIFFDGQNLLNLSETEMTHVRGNRISMIFQQPQTALNPVFKVGDQISEVLSIHQDCDKDTGRKRAIELLTMVGIPEPEKRANAFPHELSGGMAQRVMIAMALACVPELLIADEPTTALDVTIQAQILDLMRDLRNKVGASVVLITHDLGVVAEMAERVAVMYAGRIVEQADVKTLFASPRHPYTIGLMGSIPILGKIKEVLEVIPGMVPNLVNLPPGCRFAPRCKARIEHQLQICTEIEPDLIPVSAEHLVRCWLYQDREGHHAPLG
ncbi:MAG TPA: ABC transporter ATP-binding protein [Anaerolineales bacterium]